MVTYILDRQADRPVSQFLVHGQRAAGVDGGHGPRLPVADRFPGGGDQPSVVAAGRHHVADDEPAPVREVLQELARVLGAKPPRRVPAWLARMLAGQGAVDIMTKAVGISSEKAKRELDWIPQYPSWRTGVAKGLG